MKDESDSQEEVVSWSIFADSFVEGEFGRVVTQRRAGSLDLLRRQRGPVKGMLQPQPDNVIFLRLPFRLYVPTIFFFLGPVHNDNMEMGRQEKK